MKKLIIILLASICFACNTEEQTRGINYKEMVAGISDGSISMATDITYYNLDGNPISEENKSLYANDLPYALWHVNTENQIVKVMMQDKDVALRQMIKNPLVTQPDQIDCENLESLLAEIYHRDQDTRTTGAMDENVDLANLKVVEMVLEKCGMPTPMSAGAKGISAIWLVIQHAGKGKQEKYLPLLKKATADGVLPGSSLALTEDRIEMYNSRPQIYGSQITKGLVTGDWVLYKLKDPETVDARRASVELEPLSEYVKRWDIVFDVPQKDLDD